MYKGLMTVTAVMFVFWGIVLAIHHAWGPAAILILFAVFGFWLVTRYGRYDRWGR